MVMSKVVSSRIWIVRFIVFCPDKPEAFSDRSRKAASPAYRVEHRDGFRSAATLQRREPAISILPQTGLKATRATGPAPRLKNLADPAHCSDRIEWHLRSSNLSAMHAVRLAKLNETASQRS